MGIYNAVLKRTSSQVLAVVILGFIVDRGFEQFEDFVWSSANRKVSTFNLYFNSLKKIKIISIDNLQRTLGLYRSRYIANEE